MYGKLSGRATKEGLVESYIHVGGKVVGHFGQLHPVVAEQYRLAGRAILVGELDLEALQAATPGRYTYSAVPRFPAALLKLSSKRAVTLPVRKTMVAFRPIQSRGCALSEAILEDREDRF